MAHAKSDNVPAMLLALAAAIVLLLSGYIGSYYALARPGLETLVSVGDGEGAGTLAVMVHPNYGMDSSLLARFYYPLHRFDRWLRPDIWSDRPAETEENVW